MRIVVDDEALDRIRADVEAAKAATMTKDEAIRLQAEEIEHLRELLRQWRQTAEIAQDMTFAPVAKATDEILGE